MAYRVDLLAHAADDIEKETSRLDAIGLEAGSRKLVGLLGRAMRVVETFPAAYPRARDRYLAHRGVRVAPMGRYLLFYRLREHWALSEGGEVVERAATGGCEGVVQLMRVLGCSESARGLVLDAEADDATP